MTRYYTAGDALDDINCRQCFYLPICGGGCPYRRLENEFEGKCHDMCENIKDNLEEFLELHYDFFQKMKQKENKTNKL